MSWFLNVVYLLLLLLLSPWLAWNAWTRGKDRQGWSSKLLGAVPARVGTRPCIWFHAVSVGEVNLLQSLLRELRPAGEIDCIITSTTRSGYELAQQKYPQHLVAYCPFDFSWAVRRALRQFRPNLLVLTELELWPNLIRLADCQGIPVAIVNGRLGDASYRGYQRIWRLMAPILRRVTWIGAQTESYARRFTDLGADPARVLVTGSIKFDGAETDRDNPRTRQLAGLAGIESSDVVFLAGSTQEPEERLALAAFQQLAALFPQLRLILVPRHPERFDAVAELLRSSGVSWQRRSRLTDVAADPARILLVDTIGELGAWWGVAQIAYVGGSMGDRGGQNMIEPAAYGAAVSFGPNTWNFRDVVHRFLQAEAATVVNDGGALTEFVHRCLNDPRYRQDLGGNAQRLVRGNQGAARRTCEQLRQLLPPPKDGSLGRGTVSDRADSTLSRKSA